MVLTAIRAIAALALCLLALPYGMGLALCRTSRPVLTYFGGLMASWTAFWGLSLVFHAALGSLRVMTGVWLALCVAVAAFGCLRCRPRGVRRAPAPGRDAVQALLLAAVVALVLLQTLNTVGNTYYGNWDDETYCSIAVTSWYTDTVNRCSTTSGALLPAFDNVKYVLASWPVYSASLALLTGLHPAIVFRTLLPLFEIPACWCLWYGVVAQFFRRERRAALLAMLLLQALALLAAERTARLGVEWWMLVNCWTGKSVGGGLIVPLILWLMVVLPDADAPARGGCWKILFLTCCAGCFVSASMFFLIPVQVALWGGVYVLHSRDAKALLRLGACVAPAAVCILAALL